MTQTIILPTREMNWKTVRTDDEKRRIERKERDKCGKNEERERERF